MAIRRTRKDREHAQELRQQQTSYTLSPQAAEKPVKLVPAKLAPVRSVNAESVFGFAPKLLYQDLLKTVVVSAMVFGLLAAIVVFDLTRWL